MGHKVNPVGMRVGVNREWNSRWYATDKEFPVYLNEDIKIRKYLEGSLKEALLSHVEIERTKSDKGNTLVVKLFVARPGVVIGTDGKNILVVKEALVKLTGNANLRVDVIEVKNPDLDANIVAASIAKQLEERASLEPFKRKLFKELEKLALKDAVPLSVVVLVALISLVLKAIKKESFLYIPYVVISTTLTQKLPLNMVA